MSEMSPPSPPDRDTHILATGGQIFMAEAEGPSGVVVLGTCALLAEPDGAYELAKMAVRETDYARANIKMVLHLSGAPRHD